jgi:CRP-like cAMP-binding protein
MTTMTPEDWQIVRLTPFFGASDEKALRSLIQGVTAHRKGETLFQQGQEATSFFVVLEGLVKLFRIVPDGSEAVVGVFGRGQSFGEAVMFLGGRYPVNAEVVSDARLVRIDGNLTRSCIREQPELAFAMLASTSIHLKALVEQIERLKLLTGPQRVAEFLMRHAARREGGAIVELPYEKTLIANKLGMKPESFSRALAKLRPLGISVDRDRVTIVDVALLDQFIQASARGDEGFYLSVDFG